VSTIRKMGGVRVPMLLYFKFQKAIYLIWKALYTPCGSFLILTILILYFNYFDLVF